MKSTTLGALAALIADMSGGRWDAPGVAAALARIPNSRPLGQTAAAAMYAALIRTDQATPACIPLDGEHWRAYDHMIGRALGPITPVPSTNLTCPDHGQHHGVTCPKCAANAAPPERAAKHLAAARKQLRDARPDNRVEQSPNEMEYPNRQHPTPKGEQCNAVPDNGAHSAPHGPNDSPNNGPTANSSNADDAANQSNPATAGNSATPTA